MKKTNIVFLLGLAGSGKDTVGEIFQNHNYIRVAFSDKPKEEYARLHKFDVSDLIKQGPIKESHRVEFIKFAEGERQKDPFVWINKAFEPYRESGEFKEGLNLVITDHRRDSEVDWYYDLKEIIKAKSDFFNESSNLTCEQPYINLYLFHIQRDGIKDTDILTHYTIGKVYGINKCQPGFIDAVIKNNQSLTELDKKVKRLIEIFNL